MKTAEEFIKELEGSEELRKELEAVEDKAALEAFLKNNGCGFGGGEFVKALSAEGELSDTDSEAVAGGYFYVVTEDKIRHFRERYGFL